MNVLRGKMFSIMRWTGIESGAVTLTGCHGHGGFGVLWTSSQWCNRHLMPDISADIQKLPFTIHQSYSFYSYSLIYNHGIFIYLSSGRSFWQSHCKPLPWFTARYLKNEFVGFLRKYPCNQQINWSDFEPWSKVSRSQQGQTTDCFFFN